MSLLGKWNHLSLVSCKLVAREEAEMFCHPEKNKANHFGLTWPRNVFPNIPIFTFGVLSCDLTDWTIFKTNPEDEYAWSPVSVSQANLLNRTLFSSFRLCLFILAR